MDADDPRDFFPIFSSLFVNIALKAEGRVGLESDPWLVSHKLCFSLQTEEDGFETESLGLVRKKKKTNNLGMRGPRPNRAPLKEFVV